MRKGGVSKLVVLSVLALIVLGGPAGSHVTRDLTHLKSHLRRTYAKKTRVYTKAQASARFVSAGLRVVNVRDSVAAESGEEKIVNCPAGYQAIGGGWAPSDPATISENSSGPIIAGGTDSGEALAGTYSHATGWYVDIFNFTGQTREYGASVICARPGG